MRKHNQIHTLSAPHYKAYFRFLSKLKDFKCALWSEKYGSYFRYVAAVSPGSDLQSILKASLSRRHQIQSSQPQRKC